MNCERFATIVDAWVDDELDPLERVDAERHAARCPRCAAEASAVREIVSAAGELPRSIDPSRDLFPEIRTRLARKPASHGWLVLAASILLLTTALWVGLRRPDGSSRPVGQAPELAAAGAALERASVALSAALDERRLELPAEAAASFDDGLAVVEAAIAQARAAVASDPRDPRAQRALNDLYRAKLDMFWRASRLAMAGA